MEYYRAVGSLVFLRTVDLISKNGSIAVTEPVIGDSCGGAK